MLLFKIKFKKIMHMFNLIFLFSNTYSIFLNYSTLKFYKMTEANTTTSNKRKKITRKKPSWVHSIYKHTARVNEDNNVLLDYIVSESDSNFSEEDAVDEDVDDNISPPPKKLKAEREKKMYSKFLDFLIMTNQPFSIVNNPELKDFVQSLNPSYKLPCKSTLTDTLLPEKVSIKKLNNELYFLNIYITV